MRGKNNRAAKVQSPGAWRPLDDSDLLRLSEAMGELGCNIGEDDREQLRRRINDELTQLTKLHQSRRPPHKEFEKLRRIQNAVAELQAALHAYNAERHFPYMVDWIEGHPNAKEPASLDALRAEFPDADEMELFLVAKRADIIVPSGNAKATIASALQRVRQLGLLAKFAEKRARARQAYLGTSEVQAKQIDKFRYDFIAMLGYIYEEIFHVPPKATRGGPWCVFLAIVLSCCSGKELSSDQVYPIWLKVRKWRQENLDALFELLAKD